MERRVSKVKLVVLPYFLSSWLLQPNSRTTCLLDVSKTIAITCVSENDMKTGPSTSTWHEAMARLAIFLEDTRQKYEPTLSAKDRSNRRGPFTTVNHGITRGSGAKVGSPAQRLFIQERTLTPYALRSLSL